jgi:hypothetical protein
MLTGLLLILITNMDYPTVWRGENYLTLAIEPVELATLT